MDNLEQFEWEEGERGKGEIIGWGIIERIG